jgi:hypothetical protein
MRSKILEPLRNLRSKMPCANLTEITYQISKHFGGKNRFLKDEKLIHDQTTGAFKGTESILT